MGITEHGTNRCFTAGWGLVAKPCDFCNSAPALLFCRTDSAFLCVACDGKMHPPTATGKICPPTRHERVWMCEVCEQAPASVTCKADAAALCVTCDHDIHTANPLAQRHERSPVVPFYDTAELVVKTTAAAAAAFLVPTPTTPPILNPDSDMVNVSPAGHEYCVSDAWISSNPMIPKVQADAAPDIKSMEFLFSDSDNYLDFDYPIASEARGFQHNYSSGADGVVPVQTIKPQFQASNLPAHHHHSSGKRFEIEFTKSNISYGFTAAQSLSHSVSSSSLDVGVVPDGSSMSEISYPFGRNLSNVDMSGASSGENQGSQLASGMDREARVLRYREKRKNRKFEKTIRYASRKAYAETRPRIKGRFAKRTDTVDSDIDRMFSPSSAAAFFPESRYGVVPSF